MSKHTNPVSKTIISKSVVNELNQAREHCEAALRMVPTNKVNATPLINAMYELTRFCADIQDWENDISVDLT